MIEHDLVRFASTTFGRSAEVRADTIALSSAGEVREEASFARFCDPRLSHLGALVVQQTWRTLAQCFRHKLRTMSAFSALQTRSRIWNARLLMRKLCTELPQPCHLLTGI